MVVLEGAVFFFFVSFFPSLFFSSFLVSGVSWRLFSGVFFLASFFWRLFSGVFFLASWSLAFGWSTNFDIFMNYELDALFRAK